jgi:hypothetical protein
MKTIESEIYEAFAKSGAILQANATDPGKVLLNKFALLTFRAAFSERQEQIKASMQQAT